MPAQAIALSAPEGLRVVEVNLRRVPSARRIKLTVRPDGAIWLTLPPGVSEHSGLDFAKAQEAFLLRALAKSKPTPGLVGFLRAQDWVSALGRRATVLWETPADRPVLRSTARFEPDSHALRLTLATDPVRAESDLKHLLWETARRVLPPRISALVSTRPELPQPTVSVRDQVSRWGSCSGRGGLSLNWRLVLLPPDLADHVVWHELAHLKHLDHSPYFWRYLRELDELADVRDRELDRMGGDIMRLGRKG